MERLVGGYFVAVPNFDALGICIGEVTVSAWIQPHSWIQPHPYKMKIEPQSKTTHEKIQPHLE